MQSLSCAYTDRARDWVREEARCIMRRFAVQPARARARAHANRWIVAKRCVLRSTSGKLLRLLFFSPLVVFSVSLSRARSAEPAPFAFFGRSSRKRTVAPRSRFHTSSLLFSRRDPLHNVHLCRPAKRCRVPKQRQSTPISVMFLALFLFLSFLLFRARPFATRVICVFDIHPAFILFYFMFF